MLDIKSYYKMLGAALFSAVLVYGVNGSYINNTQVAATIAQEEVQGDIAAQNEDVALSSILDEAAEAAKLQEPTIIEYTVKTSDTIEGIATTYGIKPSTITASNNLSANTALSEGQKLTFPSVDGVIYKIKGGETLWDLSLLYKISSEAIIAVNKLENPDKLKLDQAIIIPNAEKFLALEASTSSSSNTSSSTKKTTASKTTVAINRGAKPASGSITSKFGERWGRDHNGIDIAASTGTNIYAYQSGKVTFSGWKNGYGNVVIISHGSGLQTYYGHCSKLLVKTGQSVEKGQHIAEVGSTGRSTGPHLHFEVRKNGTPVNPAPYLK
jgi:murein DD-endopeptidase MepM/ murein hydrolase activator NlpD